MTNSNDVLLLNDPILIDIVKRLVDEFHPLRVFLFGSRARGDANDESDYDLLIIMPVTNTPSYQLAQQAHRNALRGIPFPIDVVFVTEKIFDENKSIIGTLPELAIHEGKELYAA